MMRERLSRLSPAQLLLGSIIFTIALGTLLLCLPAARVTTVPLLDIFFTATSATTVTGLITIPLDSFTLFGQIVLLVLMQIGGLGLITMMLFVASFFVEFGFGTQLLLGQLFELDTWKNVRHLLLFVVGFTLLIESIAAYGIFFIIQDMYPFGRAVFVAIFHAVSAFCNVGFSILPAELNLQYQAPLLLLITFVIICGGLGFVTWHELYHYARSRFAGKRPLLSLHSRIVLFATFSLIALSMLLFWLFEYGATLHGMSMTRAAVNSLFNVVASRSAGFASVATNQLSMPTLLLTIIIAFVGSSPGSTGSGIKTTTLVVFLTTIWAVITQKNEVNISGREIPVDQVYKAFAIVMISFLWITAATFLLLLTERMRFIEVLFEAVSAFATMGLSVGVTAALSVAGKVIIILTMIAGRIGSLTLILALLKKRHVSPYAYPEERVMLG